MPDDKNHCSEPLRACVQLHERHANKLEEHGRRFGEVTKAVLRIEEIVKEDVKERQIQRGLDLAFLAEVKTTLNDMDKATGERLVLMEQSGKTAHHRIDMIEKSWKWLVRSVILLLAGLVIWAIKTRFGGGG